MTAAQDSGEVAMLRDDELDSLLPPMDRGGPDRTPHCPRCAHCPDDHNGVTEQPWQGIMARCWNCLHCNPDEWPPKGRGR